MASSRKVHLLDKRLDHANKVGLRKSQVFDFYALLIEEGLRFFKLPVQSRLPSPQGLHVRTLHDGTIVDDELFSFDLVAGLATFSLFGFFIDVSFQIHDTIAVKKEVEVFVRES